MEKGNLLNFLLLLWGSSSSSSSRLVVSKYRHCIAYCFHYVDGWISCFCVGNNLDRIMCIMPQHLILYYLLHLSVPKFKILVLNSQNLAILADANELYIFLILNILNLSRSKICTCIHCF